MPRTSVISAFINDNASGGGSVGPDGTQYYVELTIQSSQVASTLTDFPVYVDLSDMPAAFFTNVQSDGGDIRVTESDGTTRCPVDLVSIDTGGSTGELHFLASSISSSSDTTFRIYYDTTGTSSQPGVATTYGRNAVWADYSLVMHMDDGTTDSTGNHSPSDSGTAAATGALGGGRDFDGSSDDISIANATSLNATGDFTVSVWVKGPASIPSTQMIAEKDLGSPNDGWLFFLDSSGAGNIDFRLGGTYTGGPEVAGAADGTFHYLSGGRSGTTGRLSLDGGTFATVGSITGSLSNTAGMSLGEYGVPNTLQFDGVLDEYRFRLDALSQDWVASEYTNQNTPTTFYTVGSQTAV